MLDDVPAQRATVAVVDDEPGILSLLTEYLCRDGYAVHGCADATELDDLLTRKQPDIVLLDVELPGEDGMSIVRRLNVPGGPRIIMLTAQSEVIDRIFALEVGADDYVCKPFDLRELRARVRAVLRRAGTSQPPVQSGGAKGPVTSFGAVALDLDAHCLIDRNGKAMPLTATEFYLLEAFARSPNRVLSRDQLLDSTPGQRSDPFDRSIDIRIARVRKKIEADPAKPQVIRTVRGLGYMFVPPDRTHLPASQYAAGTGV